MNALRSELIKAANSFYHRGWMLGTAGNLSARINKTEFWVTASGRPKGNLTDDDFIVVDLEDQLPKLTGHLKSSAETIIHQSLYRFDDSIGAVYHVHTKASNLLTRLYPDSKIRLPAIEMIKGLGFWDVHPVVDVMVTPNYPTVKDIADELIQRLPDFRNVPGFLIRDHGITAWGRTPQEAMNRCEIWCYLCEWMVEAKALQLH
ncbi:MAG: methylthioribulose 1-phosphate dehydratase [Myxococcota bacterium]|nr:methylthioribulose 1-phosphate dehydratase [Myxococcota bacterium]